METLNASPSWQIDFSWRYNQISPSNTFHSLYLFELIRDGRDDFIKEGEGWPSGDLILLFSQTPFK